MDPQQESSKIGAFPVTMSRNLSSSSSAFFSAAQSPFFSPKSPRSHESESLRLHDPNPSDGFLLNSDQLVSGGNLIKRLELISSSHVGLTSSICTYNFEDPEEECGIPDGVSSSDNICSGSSSYYNNESNYPALRARQKRKRKIPKKFKYTPSSAFLSSACRLKTCDVYIGFHGRKPSLLRFANWLRVELEFYGISCFAADASRCRSDRSHATLRRAMNASTLGVVILTKKSFANPYCIEELGNFLDKKNLLPIFFDMGVNDCLARDIVEQRGDLWDRHGGELWMLYGGLEKEWREALNGLIRMDDWKLEAHDGNWRDCILNAVALLATRLRRRSAVERVNKWREKIEKEEFPFPRNEYFIGRRRELSELELILFGDVSEDGEKEFFEVKTRRRQKSLVVQMNENDQVKESMRNHQSESSSKGKGAVIWKESKKEIELQNVGSPRSQFQPPMGKRSRKIGRRKKPMEILYGRGIACVSGDSGIGKTELALEYAHRFSQRYKMVLWMGGENRYIRQNYLNLHSFLEVDVGIDNQSSRKGKVMCFEKREEKAISTVRKEFMRDIPFLVIIDNLENENDWWDQKNIMDLLPRFGGETHFIITTRLPRVMNLEPMRLSFLSGMEAITLMKGNFKDYPVAEIDALRIIEERLGRLTLGLAIVGSILSELPISPSRLLDTVNRMMLRDISWNDRDHTLRRHSFLMQLLEVCFSVFDHADGPWSLATKMVQVSGWFAPAAISVPLLALAANRIPGQRHRAKFWEKCMRAFTFCCKTSNKKSSETEASSMLVRFGIAKSTTKTECIYFHELIKLYARKRGPTKVAHAMVQAVSLKESISQHPDHLWAACFLLLGFGSDSVVVEPKPSELLFLVKHVALPLAIHSFLTFSRCNAALELLHLCTDALEVSAESLLSQSENWIDKSFFRGRPLQSNNAKHTYLWQELALLRATVLETRTKLLLRGGQYELGDDLIRKAIFIRTSIYGEHHPDTVSAQETLSKLVRLISNTQFT